MYSLPQSYNQTSKCKRCICPNAYGKPTVRIYYLTTLFPHADNETPRSDNESYTPSTRNSFSNPEWTEKTAEALVDLTEAKGWNHESHSIYLEAGYGFAYGNAGIRLKYISPVVFGLTVHIPEHTRSLSGSLLGYKTIP